jgi:uncharacterized membrane protein
MTSRKCLSPYKKLTSLRRPGARLAAIWLMLPPLCLLFYLPLHGAAKRAGEESGGIGGTGVAVEVGSVDDAIIGAASQYAGGTARHDNQRRRDS